MITLTEALPLTDTTSTIPDDDGDRSRGMEIRAVSLAQLLTDNLSMDATFKAFTNFHDAEDNDIILNTTSSPSPSFKDTTRVCCNSPALSTPGRTSFKPSKLRAVQQVQQAHQGIFMSFAHGDMPGHLFSARVSFQIELLYVVSV